MKTIESIVARIDEKRAYEGAERRFISTCGFDLENNKKHQRMMSLARKVREDGIEGIDIRAVYTFLDKEAFSNGKLTIGENTVSCNYMTRIPEDAVEGVYIYMLTAGECFFSSEENIMDFLNADIWGTTYVDSGIDALKEDFILKDISERFGSQGKEVYLSEEFGPGYFGMPVFETKKFVGALDADKIGIWVKESGLMIPQKSCAGFYFVYNRNDIKAEPSCMRCEGNSKGCAFCSVRPV